MSTNTSPWTGLVISNTKPRQYPFFPTSPKDPAYKFTPIFSPLWPVSEPWHAHRVAVASASKKPGTLQELGFANLLWLQGSRLSKAETSNHALLLATCQFASAPVHECILRRTQFVDCKMKSHVTSRHCFRVDLVERQRLRGNLQKSCYLVLF